MDASRYNSPSRKSRFRSHGGAPHRPAAVPAGEPAPEAVEEEPAPVYAEPEAEAEYAPAEETYLAEPEPLAPEPPPQEEDSLPAGLRLTRSADSTHTPRRGLARWIVALVSALCLLAGGIGGYFLRANNAAAAAPAASTGGSAAEHNAAPVLPLAPVVLADVDAAFAANKTGQFADARQRFDALAGKHPDWVSMRIEAARATLYEHDFDAAGAILAAVERQGPNADAAFLTGLLQMTTQAYDKSEAAFARAVAINPAQAEIFYFWGECLRREGKPQDAAEKFRQALIRNQYETTEGLYQLKLWLSEIQSDQEKAKDTNARIDADLASGHPSGPGLFAAAAREIKAGRFKEAGEHIGQAQKVMEPAVFRVILQDPTFLEQNFRPELAPYYQP